MDFDDLKDRRSGLGTAAVIVMNNQTDVIDAILRLVVHDNDGGCAESRPTILQVVEVHDGLPTLLLIKHRH